MLMRVSEVLRHRVWLAITIVLIGASVGGASLVSRASGDSGTQQHLVVHKIDASWAVSYGSIGDLKRSADLVVLATVQGPPSSYQGHDQLSFTDFTFTVDRVLSDPHHQLTGNTVTVHQTGGQVGNQVVEVEDDPLMQAGEEAVLFLHEYAPGHYFVLGGPQGRFIVSNGQVHAVSANHIPSFTGPVSLDQFLGEVASAG